MVRVLVVGEVDRHEAVVEILRDAGHDVDLVFDVPGALDALERTRADCLLLGRARRPPDRVVSILRRHGHAQPVVALASELGNDVDGEGFEATVGARLDGLVDRVETVADDHRIERERARRRQRRRVLEQARRAAADGPDEVCQVLVDSGEYRVAWLGRYHDSNGRVTPRTAAGVPLDHLQGVAADPGSETVTGWAVQTGAVAVETPDDADRVDIAVPVGDEPVAVLHLAAPRPGGVPMSERRTLESLGRDLAETLDGSDDHGTHGDPAVFGDALAHELSNKLEAARTHLRLAEGTEDGESAHFEHVHDALERMSDLAEEARLLAEGAVDAEPVDLGALARETWHSVETDGATLETTGVTVEADPDLVGLMFENLFRNSVEHGSTSPRSQAHGDAVEHGSTSPRSKNREDAVERASPRSNAVDDGGTRDDSRPSTRDGRRDAGESGPRRGRPGGSGGDVTVTVAPTTSGFYVADDGPGIPPDERDRVLEWGYGDGTGIGLGVVSLVAERHDWSVSVTESEGGGARFEFSV